MTDIQLSKQISCKDDHDPASLPVSEALDIIHASVALNDEVEDVRARAALSLGQIGRNVEESVLAIIGALSDENSRVRCYALEGLGTIGSQAEPAVPAIANALKNDPDPSVRAFAAKALGKIRPEAARPALLEALGDKSFHVYILDTGEEKLEYVRDVAADALNKIHPRRD